MHSIQTALFGGTFSLLPAVLFAARFVWRKPSWWLILLLVVVIGWGTYLMTVVAHFESLQETVQATENPDQQLLDEAYADGGPLVFAAFFGWAYALAYALPWFILYLLACAIRRVLKRLSGH